MERAISEMEKIRRAEEIYSRRKNGSLASYKEESNSSKSLYKIFFQILILFDIAVTIVAIQNKDYIFTKEFLNQVNEYNINIKSRITEMFTYTSENENVVNNEENIVLNDSNLTSSLKQMDIDVQKIKEKYSLILPVNGTKTSEFGTREANEIVTAYHTGVDIANEKGTIIKASLGGKVILVSEKGDYGNHLKISTDEIITLYAHCSKIYVKEGDIVEQGQDIAEVGSTGNSTGNHLHFEVRFEDRFINPELLIEI